MLISSLLRNIKILNRTSPLLEFILTHNKLITSPNDPKQYRYIELENKLKILLIQDNQCNESAASMVVNVGHFDDPIHRQGMAHFLEHMLFLGTRKYPQHQEFQTFLSQHAGESNAWTGSEYTNFFFSINSSAFFDALDRFGQFFISPTFELQFIDSERHIIDSEFKLKLNDDIRRIYEVQKETASKYHPFHKFSVGNLQTLEGDPILLRQELMRFYKHHYSANLMTLCLSSPLELSEQEDFCHTVFNQIKNKNLLKKYPQVPLYESHLVGIKIDIKSKKHQNKLILCFPLHNEKHLYKEKTLMFISYLIDYEGENSLLHQLKIYNLATNLTANTGVHGYNFKNFTINIELTAFGKNHIDKILILFFSYIKLIKENGLVNWRYLERKRLLNTEFEYQERISPINYVSHLSMNMHKYPIADIIYGDYRMDGLNEAIANKLLDSITFKNTRVKYINNNINAAFHSYWYNTPYNISTLKDNYVNADDITNNLTLPHKNYFISKNIRLHKRSKPYNKVPTILKEATGLRIWFKQDITFNSPKGHIFLSIDSKCACSTVKEAALTKLYVSLLLEALTEKTYLAETAGINFNIYVHQCGITLHIYGYTAKQYHLFLIILKYSHSTSFTHSLFEQEKKELQKRWCNKLSEKPISQLFSHLTVFIQQNNYSAQELNEALTYATYKQFQSHIHHLYEKTHMEGLIYGNYTHVESTQLANKFAHLFRKKSMPATVCTRNILSINKMGTKYNKLNIHHKDSAIIVYYQAKQNNNLYTAYFSLLEHIISSPFFNELRTIKQLGYMLGSGYLPINNHPGIIFYIQSSTTDPFTLLKSIDEYLSDFIYYLLQLSNDNWLAYKANLIQKLISPKNNLNKKCQYFWSCIGNRDYQFNFTDIITNKISNLSKLNLIAIISSFKKNNSDRLIIFSQGENHILDKEMLPCI